MKSPLGAQQGEVGAEPKPRGPEARGTSSCQSQKRKAQRSILTMGSCELLMAAFFAHWEIYISNRQFARLWLAQLKLSDTHRTCGRVKYNSKF